MSFSVFKNFFIGISIFLVPYYLFLTPHNFKWVDESSVSNIFIFSFIIIILLIIISFLTNLFFFIIFKKKIQSIFILYCFGFFLLFLFVPLRDLFFIKILNSSHLSIGSAFITLATLFLFWLIIFFLFYKFKVFKKIFIRTILIFSLFNLLLYLFINYTYIYNYLQNDKIYQNYFINQKSKIDIEKLVLDYKFSNKISNNIYYIILDGMIEIPHASELQIIKEKEVRENLERYDLKIIDNTYANYAQTDAALSALLELDYVVTEDTPRYFSRKYFFPSILYQDMKPVMIPQLIKNLGGDFYWIGNGMFPCVENSLNYVKCLSSSTIAELLNLSKSFFGNTPMAAFIYRLPYTDNWNYNKKGQRNVNFFVENINKDIFKKQSNFFFIHQMSPHPPYKVSSKCEKYDFKDNTNHSLVGYAASYKCVLREIYNFMDFIIF